MSPDLIDWKRPTRAGAQEEAASAHSWPPLREYNECKYDAVPWLREMRGSRSSDRHQLEGYFQRPARGARRLRAGGRIINFSTSVIGLRLENYGLYAATKAAVEALTAILSREMRGRSITVNAVAPGPTATALFLDGKSPELIERMSKMNPLAGC
jgi:NAD(P)-dependent dehydrogenase (short-subunit alcohol dehydrogenase family)